MERYKVVLSNSRMLREVELEPDAKEMRIGTGKDCMVRFDIEMFFEEFGFKLENQGESWALSCETGTYVSADGVLKLSSRELIHGDNLILKYSNSNQEILNISFTLDFEYETKDYDRVVDINEVHSFTIGGTPGCDIELKDPLLGRDQISASHRGGKITLKDNGTRYGIYVNGLRITDDEVTISDYDFFSLIGFSFYYKHGTLYTQKTPKMVVGTLVSEIRPESDGRFEYPIFNRNTRVVIPVPSEPISILDPPAKPEKNKESFILKILPTISMVGVMAVVSRSTGSGTSMMLRTGLMAVVTIVMTIIGIVGDSRTFKKETAEREEKYRAYSDKKRNEVQGKRDIEKEILEDTFYAPDKEIKLVEEFSSDLFDRIPDDTDFLYLRVGTGPVQSNQQVDYKEQETLEVADELALLPAAIANEFRDLPAAPITVNGKDTSAIGFVGARPRLYEMFKNVLLDLTTRQYYDDVQLFLMTTEELASSIAWTRFIPHLYNKRLGIRNFICDEESKNYLFEFLYKELSFREESKTNSPRIIVISYSDAGMKSHPIFNYYATASELGVTFLFFEEKKHNLPLGCGQIITLHSGDNSGTVVAREDDTTGLAFSYIPIDESQAAGFVQKLAPVYCEEVSLESNLTKSITYYEMLGILSVNDINLAQRWTTSEIHKSMAAPLGVNAKNELINLDLHEKFHGPHGLVAGTTGAGKSEILQSYILSCAINFHPYEISFVIIDFKGGGMVDQFTDLPHLNGAITNIDGREIDRSLKSIKAELKKRQSLFRQAEVNNIGDYIKAFKAGKVEVPLPHLILVVDEFAELKQEQPDFMKELVSAARIGRSLGVHLILATQKPSGVVDDQIWSNSKFKLCLKVQNAADSNEVLKSPLAAEIREPGRAYLQVGNNEIFELFQSAYSGAPAVANTDTKKKFQVYTTNLWGQKQLIFEQKASKTGDIEDTQLDAVVKHIAAHAVKESIKQLPGICLPPLRENISYSEMTVQKSNADEVLVPLGIYDDPDHQSQLQYSMDLISGNVFIVGASQFGKTAMLQLMIRGLAEQYSPEEVSIYILDFASMALKTFDSLPQVGGVVTSSDDVKLKTFFKMVQREIIARKDKFSKLGITSFASYKEGGFTDLPFIVVMLDNIAAFRELYDAYDDELVNICREGLSVGVNVIVTTAATRGVGYKYMSNFANRVALYCNTKDEYSNVFERCRMEPKSVPGRGLITIDKEIYEYHNYLPFEGEKEIDRVNDIKQFVDRMSQRYTSTARRIPEIPEILTESFVDKAFELKPYNFAIGMAYETVDAVLFDLTRIGYFAVAGREGGGRKNFIKYMLNHLRARQDGEPVEVSIFDDYSQRLKDLSDVDIVKEYSTEAVAIEKAFEAVSQECDRRKSLVHQNGYAALDQLPLLVLIIRNPQFFEKDGVSRACVDAHKALLKTAKEVKLLFVYSDIENEPISFSGPETKKHMKDNKNYIYLDDIDTMRIYEPSLGEKKSHKRPIDTGDAFYITERGIARVKTPLYEEA